MSPAAVAWPGIVRAKDTSESATAENELTTWALERLTRAVGSAQAPQVLRDMLAAIDCDALETPQDLLALGRALVRKGGSTMAVGYSIKVRAVLRGANEAE